MDAIYALIMEYEEDNLPLKELVELFQHLVVTGMIWKMPTRYLDVVSRMVANGHIKFPRWEGR